MRYWLLNLLIAALILVLPGGATPVHAQALNADPTTVTATQFAALFLDSDAKGEIRNTDGTTIQVDSQGGIHLTYTLVTGDEPRPAIYAYCPADCTTPASWKKVALGHNSGTYASISWAQLELDRTVTPNRPRILLESIVPAYSYAACDMDCTNPANWRLTPLVPDNTGALAAESRSFALDPQGRPRFIYYSASNGTLYLFCDSGCTDASNWQQTVLTQDQLQHPSLAFTPAGGLRLVNMFWDSAAETTLLDYVECAADCDDSNNWLLVSPFNVGNSYQGFRLRVDSQGRPRIALFPGTSLQETQSTFKEETLYYLWCDTDCLQKNNWQYAEVSAPPADSSYYGQAPDLILDAADQPHIAFNFIGGLGYARCTAECQSKQGNWEVTTVESDAQLNQSHPVEPSGSYANCTDPTWSVGDHPAIALGLDGKPLISYDAPHLVLCSNFNVVTNLKWARVALSEPSENGGQTDFLFLPMLQH